MLKVITSEPETWGTQILLTGNTDGVQIVRVSRDASRVLCVGVEGSLFLWDTDTGSLVGTSIPGQPRGRAVQYAELSPSGTHLAYATGSGILHVWDAALGRLLWQRNYGRDLEPWYEPNSWGQVIRFSPTKPYLALLTRCHGEGVRWKTMVSFYDLDTEMPMEKRVLFEDEAILDFELMPDGRRAVFVGEGTSRNVGVAFVYDMETFERVSRVDMEYMDLLSLLITVSADSTRTAVTFRLNRLGSKGTTAPMLLLDVETGEQVVDDSSSSSHLVRFAPAGEIMACLPRTGTEIALRDKRTGGRVDSLRSQEEGADVQLLDAWFSLDGKRLAVLSSEQTISVWDVSTRSLLVHGLGGYVGGGGDGEHVVLSEDWSKVFTYSWTGSNEIGVHDMVTSAGAVNTSGKQTRRKPKLPRTRGAFIDDTRFIGPFYSDAEHPTRVWRINIGEERLETERTMEELHGLSGCIVCPDGRSMVLTLPGRLVFYSTRALEPLSIRLANVRDEVARGLGSKTFSNDGRALAISSRRFTQVWAYPSGQLLWDADGGGLGDYVALSSDGTRIVGKLDERRLGVYDLKRKTWVRSVREDLFGVHFRFAFSKDDAGMVAAMTKEGLEVWRVGETRLEMIAQAGFTASFLDGHTLTFGHAVGYGPWVWEIESGGILKPSATGSGLGYEQGWIWSAGPRRRVIPIPMQMWEWFTYERYSVCGSHVVVWDESYSPVMFHLDFL